MKIGPIAFFHKVSAVIVAALTPLGIWGLGGMALIDSGFIPIPVTMDGVLIGYVHANHHLFFLYCLMASAASALGSLVPYYVGRAGGELFLLKRINRARYERLRDRFEKQEFLAIMIPAMLPPPTPIKLFEFAAGVFEMRPLPFAAAIFCGKFVQFMVCALITIFYGPAIMHSLIREMHLHLALVLSVVGIAIVVLLGYVLRKLFDRRRGISFPVEEMGAEEDETTV